MTTVVHVNTERAWSGGEVQTFHLIRGLQARKLENVLIAQPGSEIARRIGESGIEVVEVAMRGEWDMLAVLKLRSILRRRRPDVVQLHTSHAHTLGLLAGRLAGLRPIVATRRMDHEIRGAFSRLKYRAADHVVAISHVIQDLLIAGGVPPERVSVIHSVVDCGDCQPDSNLRAELPLEGRGPVIGAVATLHERKGHRFLFAAMAGLKARHPQIRLLVVGTGPLEPQLRELVRRQGLESEVLFLGFRTDIPQVLNTLDVFVLASRKEGLGVCLLEAARAGLPIVATNVGGIPEIVKDGETGLLVPPADSEALVEKIERLLADPEYARELGDNARTFVEKEFSLESMVRGYRQLYERLLS